ncbi:threonine-phosphate decarboxylase CobD [Tahibacter amnicola]|uniref:threonine-phosphate decarboxylase n=1 Tax=Tahibacter amnicola TaxID=2976241 RepID=A0ABY6BFA1_9GAMM|nr:threonine-phosphate decarboxylase CobD [Tahibacter amnicola]UXI66537.1 threonine-phosphate decarboxylase CobD [Tahibacter amnicola]
MLEHGGRLLRAARQYGIDATQWLDLSTGINPDGWPVPDIPAAVWRRLPDDDDPLETVAAAYYGAPRVLAVAGSQAAIQALPRLRRRSRVGVIAPGYAEHAHGWSRAGHDVLRCPAQDLFESAHRFDVVVLIHPNNPGGETFDRNALLHLHQTLAMRGGWLVVDEAFMDMSPDVSLAPDTDREGLVVLRSPGKFFGLAGARAGFVAATAFLLAQLRVELGPWTVAAPTRWLLRQALEDKAWQDAARDRLQRDGARLTQLLGEHGLPPDGGTALFQWIRTPYSREIHEQLARMGILTRLFDEPPSLRFGLPGDDAGWHRLGTALAQLPQTLRSPCA